MSDVWQDILIDVRYDSDLHAVDALLTLAISDAVAQPIRACDLTHGVSIPDPSSVEFARIVPAATLRSSELASLMVDPVDLDEATIAFPNGRIWTIKSHGFKPTPEGDGEVMIYLEAAT